ncbi:hypothetical protein [Imbroritus primus]|jgi:hypothetical protein
MKLPLLSLALLAIVVAATLVVVMSDTVTPQHSEYGIGRIAARHLLSITW